MSRVLVFLALMTALTGVRCFLSPAPPLPFPRRQHQSLYGAFVHLRTSRVLPTFFSVGAKGAEREHQSTLSAKPRSRLPERTAYVVCSKCQYTLYKYKKNGKGSLVKCYEERIVEDYTKGDLTCPECATTFARKAMIHGKPAHKIIGGKVLLK